MLKINVSGVSPGLLRNDRCSSTDLRFGKNERVTVRNLTRVTSRLGLKDLVREVIYNYGARTKDVERRAKKRAWPTRRRPFRHRKKESDRTRAQFALSREGGKKRRRSRDDRFSIEDEKRSSRSSSLYDYIFFVSGGGGTLFLIIFNISHVYRAVCRDLNVLLPLFFLLIKISAFSVSYPDENLNYNYEI